MKDYIKGGEELKTTGWGLMDSNNIIPPNDLQELTVKALSNEECTNLSDFTPTTQLCAFRNKGQGICMVSRILLIYNNNIFFYIN